MENNKTEALQADLNELKNFVNSATRPRVKDLLNIEIRKVETILSDLQTPTKSEKSTPTTMTNSPDQPKTTSSQSAKAYLVELSNYGWDQSDKFVKIFVTLDDVQTVPTDNITVDFTDKSLCLYVNGLNNKNYKLIINNLLDGIDVGKSYHKVKTNMVSIYAKKANEGKNWSHLTSVEKRIKENKPDKLSKLGPGDNAPDAGLFNMMREMYQSGDAEMKRLISKAWCENEEKRRTGGADEFSL